MKHRKAGFTLVELLVTIAIIALLASIVLFATMNVRSEAENAKTAVEIHSVEDALDLFYQDNGYYPAQQNCTVDTSNCATVEYTSVDCDVAHTPPNGWDELGTYLHPYIGSMPCPLYSQSASSRSYKYFTGTPSAPYKVRINNAANGLSFVACVIVNNGYYLDFELPAPQNTNSLDDGGVDPDGIEVFRGDIQVSAVQSQC